MKTQEMKKFVRLISALQSGLIKKMSFSWKNIMIIFFLFIWKNFMKKKFYEVKNYEIRYRNNNNSMKLNMKKGEAREYKIL